jgi:hypothetical protein
MRRMKSSVGAERLLRDMYLSLPIKLAICMYFKLKQVQCQRLSDQHSYLRCRVTHIHRTVFNSIFHSFKVYFGFFVFNNQSLTKGDRRKIDVSDWNSNLIDIVNNRCLLHTVDHLSEEFNRSSKQQSHRNYPEPSRIDLMEQSYRQASTMIHLEYRSLFM